MKSIIWAFIHFQFIFLGYSFADNGISSVNGFVEKKHSATDFRSRKQNSNGMTDSLDFIVSLERENISNAGTLTMDFMKMVIQMSQ